MPKSDAAKLAAKIRRQGFDLTYTENGSVYPGCSQCVVMVINGTACHEHGCPNTR